MANVSVDYAWEEKIQEVLIPLRKHGGKIVDFNPSGPAGGNPCLLLSFADIDSALAYLDERYPDDGSEFNRTRIYP